MASTRAQEIAEVLWELKRAGKLGQYTAVAKRAGFTSGANGRNVLTTMKTVRRDWSHLQWWRAVPDTGVVETTSELATALQAGGFTLEVVDDAKSKIVGFEDLILVWPEPEVEEGAAEAAAAAAPGKPAAKAAAPKPAKESKPAEAAKAVAKESVADAKPAAKKKDEEEAEVAEEKPKKKKASEEEEKPKAKKKVAEAEAEAEKPKARKKAAEAEAEKPKAKKK